jgi:dipeptidyl aminopeptidase/acylaminoacyl peptidase
MLVRARSRGASPSRAGVPVHASVAARRALVLLAFALAPAADARAQELKTLTLDDYPRWSRITEVQLSSDGKWMTYAYAPNEGDPTLHVRQLDGDVVHTAKNGGTANFSDNGRWAAWLTSPPGTGGRGGGRAGGGGRGGRGNPPGGAQQGRGGAANNVVRTFELIDLTTSAKTTVTDVQGFRFSPDSRFVVVEKRRANNEAAHQGRDIIVRELATGTSRNIGNVSSYAFNEPGNLLAYLVDAAGKIGNGLYVVDLGSGIVQPLDTDTLRYDQLTWNEQGTAVAALRGETPADREQRANTLVAFRSLAGGKGSSRTGLSGSTTRIVYEPSADTRFPKDMVLSELGALEWSDDGTKVFVGIKAQREKVERDEDEPRTNVEVWHWADERLQSVQKVQAEADRRSTYTGVVHLDAKRFVPLADDAMPRVQRTPDDRWAIGQQDKEYRNVYDEPGGLRDIVRVNVETGERTPLVQRIRFQHGISPNSRYHLWFSDGKYWLQDIATGTKTDLSASTDVSFLDTQADRPGEKNSWGVAGWSRDGRTVLLNHQFDIWSVPLAGGRAVNLTRGIGERDRIRFRVVSLDPEADEDGIDTTKPIMLTAYGDRTKKSGYWVLEPGKEPRPVIWEDRAIGGVRKAENADRVIFTSQTFVDFPDYWLSTTRFDSPRRVTDANPQQKEYGWGRRVLVDYTDARGNDLQATLTLPAGYVEGQRYPMLVYFYEKLSQNHHNYSMPTYDDRPHFSAYASDGYLVLMPDIVYDDGKPGSSALDDVTSAVKKVIELGYADPARIGAQGHSWGGYESSFIVTQTDMFAAVVTGAPLTNLESMHNILYKQTGGGNAALIQWGQGRMGTVPWQDPEGYESQSPVRFVENITTPFMILHGTADGAVDYNQGLEFYVAARRAGKQVILLTYPDEPHHLGRKENQKDFQIRMKQFFDHYLKGTPAPKWMTEGLPFLDREREVLRPATRTTDADRNGTGR